MRLRVGVYNVRGFRDGRARLERLIGHLEPDVLLLNETGGRLQLWRFGRAVGMEVARDPWSPLRRRIKDAVLVRRPWSIVEHHQRRFGGGPWLYPRGALVARLEHPDGRMCAVSVHLGLHPRERLTDARSLVGLLEGTGTPIVVGGDLNERPDGRAVAVLTGRFHDAWRLAGNDGGETFPAAEPTARIDYLFVSDDLVVERVLVPPGPDVRVASDHLPVLARLGTRDPGSEHEGSAGSGQRV